MVQLLAVLHRFHTTRLSMDKTFDVLKPFRAVTPAIDTMK